MKDFKFISNKDSLRLISKMKSKEICVPETEQIAELAKNVKDFDKRAFLKVLGVAGLGIAATSLFPKKADALVAGSTPTSNVVGLKDSSNNRINPAKEDGNLATIATNVPAKGQATMANSMPVVIASNQTAIPISGSLSIDSVGIKDATENRISPFSEDSAVYLRRIVKLMESQAVVDSGNRQRITIDSLGTGTAVTTTVPVSGSVAGSFLIDGQGRQMFTEMARQAYNSGIRSNLIWS
jgi:hypothetical protein